MTYSSALLVVLVVLLTQSSSCSSAACERGLTSPLPPSPTNFEVQRPGASSRRAATCSIIGPVVAEARCKIPPLSLRSVLHIYSGGPTINRRVSHGVSTYKLLGNENSIPMAVEGNLPCGYENVEESRGSHVQ